MTKTKKIIFKIMIVYLIAYMLLASISSVFAETGYDAKAGEYLVQYAREYINTYIKKDENGYYNTDYLGVVPAQWTGGSDGEGIWHVVCTTGIEYMYQKALGIELTDYGWWTSTSITLQRIQDENSYIHQYFDVIWNESELKPGDILCNNGHNEMYAGNGEHFNSGSYHRYPSTEPVVKIYTPSHSLKSAGGKFDCAIRLKSDVAVNPTGRVTSTGTFISVNYAKFFFNGIPDGKYSLASRKNVFEMIFDTIKEMAIFLSQIIGYLIRGFFVGIISIFDRLINNTVQSLTDAPKSLQETGVSATNADDPYSMNRSITIEGLIFNHIDLFNIDIFK